MTRAYTKRQRAAGEEETRKRIVDAMVALHEEVGPSRTTVSAIAARAGVERLTVYRHFPDEPSMFQACSARWSELNPPPDLLNVRAGDPLKRLRAALLRLYAWYRANERMLFQVSTDAERLPAVRAQFEPVQAFLEGAAESLDRAWPRRSAARLATIRHALDFSTWRSLTRGGTTDRRAVALASSWLRVI